MKSAEASPDAQPFATSGTPRVYPASLIIPLISAVADSTPFRIISREWWCSGYLIGSAILGILPLRAFPSRWVPIRPLIILCWNFTSWFGPERNSCSKYMRSLKMWNECMHCEFWEITCSFEIFVYMYLIAICKRLKNSSFN